MTREEAIEYLKHADTTVGKKIKTRTAEALEMAIEALSAEYKHEWCHDCKEYDTEKHCCHRYSSFIRESLQDNIDAVLEDIKAEIKELTNQSMFSYVSNFALLDVVAEIIDKHISEKEQE